LDRGDRERGGRIDSERGGRIDSEILALVREYNGREGTRCVDARCNSDWMITVLTQYVQRFENASGNDVTSHNTT
jgi:hypothetical protein